MRNKMKKIVAAVMAFAMVATLGVGMTTTAFAATDGKVTINKVTGNQNVSYKGYNIFTADVNNDGSLSNISWASDAVKTAVIGAIQAVDNTYSSQSAQDAADYLAENVTGTSQATILNHDDLLNKIADAVDGVAETTTLQPGVEKTGLQTGYWLIVTDPTTTSDKTDSVGTAPIFAVVSSQSQTITSKASIPTVEKKVESKDADDAQIGDDINFKLTGTLPANYATYDTFKYVFTDTLSAGLTADADSVVVKIDGQTVTAGYTKSLENNVLTVSFADLNAAKKTVDEQATAIEVTADSVITVEYTAELNSNAVMGGSGNNNSATITYSNNPNTDSEGETTPDDVNTYTYKLHLEKKDKDTNVKLDGAKFTIKNADNKYVQADGTLSTTAHEFTATGGNLEISGLAAGTYTVTETTPPTDYKAADPFTFTITPTYTNTALTTLACSVNGTNVIAGLDTTDDRTMNADANTAAVASTGVANVTLYDVKNIDMPLSGQLGIMFGVIAGCAILGVSISAMRKNKANANA